VIRCDSEEERQALANLVWACKDVIIGHHRNTTDVAALSQAFDALFATTDTILDEVLSGDDE